MCRRRGDASCIVEHRGHMLALPPAIAERGDGGGGVALQPVGEGGITPGPGDHMRTVARADLCFIGLDDGVDSSRIDQPLATGSSQALSRGLPWEKNDSRHAHAGGRGRDAVSSCRRRVPSGGHGCNCNSKPLRFLIAPRATAPKRRPPSRGSPACASSPSDSR